MRKLGQAILAFGILLIAISAVPAEAGTPPPGGYDCNIYSNHSGWIPGYYDVAFFLEHDYYNDDWHGPIEVPDSGLNYPPPQGRHSWDKVAKCKLPPPTTTTTTSIPSTTTTTTTLPPATTTTVPPTTTSTTTTTTTTSTTVPPTTTTVPPPSTTTTTSTTTTVPTTTIPPTTTVPPTTTTTTVPPTTTTVTTAPPSTTTTTDPTTTTTTTTSTTTMPSTTTVPPTTTTTTPTGVPAGNGGTLPNTGRDMLPLLISGAILVACGGILIRSHHR